MARFCNVLQASCRVNRIAMLLALALVLFSADAYAQKQAVSGKVVDEQGLPLIGATIIETGTTNGTTTNVSGEFRIELRGGGNSIEIQSLGYVSQTLPLAGRSFIEVKLKEDAVGIDAVVAIGYGTVKQKDLTTAVSIVSTKDIENRPVNDASGFLQGRAAGVQVTQTSGLPGSGMMVRIRGNSSIASSNDPLYVVDGVPVGEGGYAISYLSPNDIESIQVLKDASSAAIYGSRAANGVVLITTKSGKKSRGPQVNFSTFVGISKVAKTYDVLNVAQYQDLMDEMGKATLPDGLQDETDWFKEAYSTGVNQNYQLSISNANENSSYYVGGGYSREDGIFKVAFSERYNVKANFESKIFKWLSASASTAFSHYTDNGIISGAGANRSGVVLSVINTPTYAKVWNPEKPNQYWDQFYGANLTTPSENMARTENNKNVNDRLILTGGITINFHRNLHFKSTVTMDRRWTHASEFLDPISTSYGRTQHGTASDTRSDDMRMIYDNILTYNNTWGKHHFEVLGGTSATTSAWEQLWGSRSYFTDSSIPNLNGGNNGGLRGQSVGKSSWAIMSYLARGTYNYDDRYLFTANFRTDGSSKLAPKARWGFFPSFSAAWRISGEKFMSESKNWLDDLKLRVGWGQTGNQSGLDDYAYLQKYNTVYQDWTDPKYANFTPSVGSKSNLKNEDLTWETTTQTNVGVDLAAFNNRLSFTFDAYYKYTKNMLMYVPMPAPYPSLYRNEGEMSNYGFEISVSSRNFVRKDFNWTTDLNISVNRNKLEKLKLKQNYMYAKTSEAHDEYVVRMTPGQPLSMFWGYNALGVDPETGDMMYEDTNGDGEVNSSDKTYIGNANPKFTFGMTNNFSWKGLNLSILITGSVGNDIYNASRIEMVGMYTGANQITDVIRRWRIPGQITDMPRANNLDNLKASTRWIEDGSYIKFKNITLSYDITSPKLRKANISRIQPYITLQNFFTLTKYSGYDPEMSQYSSATSMGIDWGTYPNVKTVVVGLNIDF